MSVHSRRDEADAPPVTVNRFVVIDQRLRIVQQELNQAAPRQARIPMRFQCFAADEPAQLIPIAGETKTGLQGRESVGPMSCDQSR